MSGRVSVSADVARRRAAFLNTLLGDWSLALLFFSADTRCQQRPEIPRFTDFTGIHAKTLLFLDMAFLQHTASDYVRVYSTVGCNAHCMVWPNEYTDCSGWFKMQEEKIVPQILSWMLLIDFWWAMHLNYWCYSDRLHPKCNRDAHVFDDARHCTTPE